MAKRRIITLSAVAVGLVLISVVSAIVLRGDKGPDFTGKSPEQIKEYFKSEAFQGLNEKEQIAVKKRAFGDYQERQVQTFIDQARIYAQLPPAQKVRFLDERIDEYVRAAEQKQQATRQKGSGSVAKADAGAKEGSIRAAKTAKARAARKPSASEGIRAWSEKMDPEQRAHILELKEAITRRMEERGIDL